MAFKCVKVVSALNLCEENRQQKDVLALALALAPLI